MMKNYLKAILFNKNALHSHSLSQKSFAVQGKVKTQDPIFKNKNYTMNDLFQNEKNEENNTIQHYAYNQIPDDVIKEDDLEDLPFEKVIEPPSIKEHIQQPVINSEKIKPKVNFNHGKQEEITYKQVMSKSRDHEDLIEKMLSQKSNNLHQMNTNTYQKSYNTNNSTNSNILTKRQKINLVREGMILCFCLRKPTSQPASSGKNDGYVYLELKEFTDYHYEERKVKDPRFMILNSIHCAKILLLDPRVYNQNDPQKINISMKNRMIEIEQNKDKTYTVIMTINLENNEQSETPAQRSNKIISRIELNPEDIIIIHRFLNMCIDELLSL